MTTAAIADFCEIVPGGREKWTGKDFIETGFPAFGAGGLNGYLPHAEFSRPAVVLSSIGARCGKCFIAEGSWSSLANTQLIFPDLARADPRFLWHQLNDESRWPRSGTAQPFIKTSHIKSHEVFLPAIREQRRIAQILDAVDALGTKRRKASAKLGTLKQAVFNDMFVRTGHAWDMRTVEEVAAPLKGAIRTGPFGSQLLHEEFADAGVAVLGIDNVVQNRFVWAKERYITDAKYAELARYTVHAGDVLVTIMGTCGRVAVVPDNVPTAINTKHLCCITLNRDVCLPAFLWGCLRYHPDVLRQLGATRGAVMPGLNMGVIKRTQIPVPPLEEQRLFAEAMRSIEVEASNLERSEVQVNRLAGALRQRAFAGQL